MKIFRRGYYSDHGPNFLTRKRVGTPQQPAWNPENESVSLYETGRSGRSTYRYTVELTAKEVRVMLGASLDNTDLTASEKELWTTLFTLWEKTITKKATS